LSLVSRIALGSGQMVAELRGDDERAVASGGDLLEACQFVPPGATALVTQRRRDCFRKLSHDLDTWDALEVRHDRRQHRIPLAQQRGLDLGAQTAGAHAFVDEDAHCHDSHAMFQQY
jgi:hypothetical protein